MPKLHSKRTLLLFCAAAGLLVLALFLIKGRGQEDAPDPLATVKAPPGSDTPAIVGASTDAAPVRSPLASSETTPGGQEDLESVLDQPQVSKEAFLEDILCQDAVIRRIEIIGEAARRVSECPGDIRGHAA